MNGLKWSTMGLKAVMHHKQKAMRTDCTHLQVTQDGHLNMLHICKLILRDHFKTICVWQRVVLFNFLLDSNRASALGWFTTNNRRNKTLSHWCTKWGKVVSSSRWVGKYSINHRSRGTLPRNIIGPLKYGLRLNIPFNATRVKTRIYKIHTVLLEGPLSSSEELSLLKWRVWKWIPRFSFSGSEMLSSLSELLISTSIGDAEWVLLLVWWAEGKAFFSVAC